MFELTTVRHHLQDELDVVFFASPEAFLRRFRKHVLNPEEAWGRVLGVRFLGKLGRKLRAGDVSE